MKYVLISESSLTTFEDRVNKWITMGYKPLGGVCVNKGSMRDYYSQAMIKEETK